MTTQTARDLLATSASLHKQSLQEHSLHMLAQIVTRLPMETLADMIAHLKISDDILTHKDGSSEATHTYLRECMHQRFIKTTANRAIETALAYHSVF